MDGYLKYVGSFASVPEAVSFRGEVLGTANEEPPEAEPHAGGKT